MLASALSGHFGLGRLVLMVMSGDAALHSSVERNAGHLAGMQETSKAWNLGKIYSCATPWLKRLLPGMI